MSNAADYASPPLDAKPSTWRAWLTRYAVPLLAAVFFVAYVPAFFRDYQDGQWRLYCKAATRMAAHEMIHVDEMYAYAYPPAMAMLSMPLAPLPELASHAVWYLINVAAVFVLVIASWRLAGGETLLGLKGTWRWVYIGGMVLAGRHLISPLENQQYDLVIAALLMSGCLALVRGREWTGGLLMGLATSMKLTPILFVPYLVWRGRPKAAAAVVAVAAMLNVMPDALWPQANGNSYLGDWHRNCIRTVVEGAPGDWLHTKANILNQSLAGMVNRVWKHGLPLDYATYLPKKEGLNAEQAAQARWFLYSLELLLAGITAWRMGRAFQREPDVAAQPGIPVTLDRLRQSLEFSAVMCSMVLFSPMSSKAHYAPLLLPTFLLVRIALEERTTIARGLVALLLLVGPLTTKGLLGFKLGVLALGWGIPTLYPLIALIGCWRAMVKEPKPADPRPTTPPAPHIKMKRRVQGEPSRRGHSAQ